MEEKSYIDQTNWRIYEFSEILYQSAMRLRTR